MTTETSNPQPPAAHDHVYLLGWPSLKGFLEHVNQTTARRPLDEPALIQLWLKANARIQELKSQDAGCANYAELLPLPQSLAEKAAAKLEEPAVRESLRSGSYVWKWVELDRLVVYQRTINLHHIARLRAARPMNPSDERLLQIAIGRPAGPEDVQCTIRDDNVMMFISHSSDIRFIKTVPLRPEHVSGVPIGGHLAGVVATFIGFGNNICSALHFRNRLLLINGSHRLYELRASGITHVPCLVQRIDNEAELGLLREEVRQNAHLYFADARPPMFKDYFDPRLHMVLPMVPVACMVQVQVVHQKVRVPVM